MKIGKLTTEDCEIGISVPANSSMQVDEAVFIRTGIGVQERDAIEGVHEFLGFKKGVNDRALADLMRALRQLPAGERYTALYKSGFLSKFSDAMMSVTGFAANLLTIVGSAQAPNIIAALGG